MLTPEGLRQRSRLLRAIRAFFEDRSYIEVDTPLRLPILIPESTLVPFTSEDCFLHTSPELCMKRLLARGCTRIFQICHCFRKEECGRLHQPEFTMLEWYHKGWDYHDLMAECEALLCSLAASLAGLRGIVHGGQALCVRDGCIELAPPWQRLTVADAFRHYAEIEVEEVLRQGRFDEVLVTKVEPHLGQTRPTFLYEYPAALGSLARRHHEHPEVVERFELYIAGVELANGFSELADPEEQRLRFLKELEMIEAIHTFRAKRVLPENFLADLPAMGKAAGIALGVDRLFMLLTGKTTLRDALPFLFEEL